MKPAETAALSKAEFAETLGVSKDSVTRAIARGEIKPVKFGRRILIPRRELKRILGGE